MNKRYWISYIKLKKYGLASQERYLYLDDKIKINDDGSMIYRSGCLEDCVKLPFSYEMDEGDIVIKQYIPSKGLTSWLNVNKFNYEIGNDGIIFENKADLFRVELEFFKGDEVDYGIELRNHWNKCGDKILTHEDWDKIEPGSKFWGGGKNGRYIESPSDIKENEEFEEYKRLKKIYHEYDEYLRLREKYES